MAWVNYSSFRRKRKKTCTNVSLSMKKDQKEYLRELRQNYGIAQSHVVRKALDDFKSKYGYPGLG